jgi:hypothetical protein
MLKPLEEWICDSCGEIIKAPEQGYVEWQETKRKVHGFRIVHHAPHSPRKRSGGNCYYSNAERGGDLSLEDLVGTKGLLILTSWIDVGEWHEDEYTGPDVRDLREWTTLFRRLQIPYFEEARLYEEQFRDVRSGGANEIYLYLPNTLKKIIEEHEAAVNS